MTRRQYMFENPNDLNEQHIITFKKQIMYEIQIAYGLVGFFLNFYLKTFHFRSIYRRVGSFIEISLQETSCLIITNPARLAILDYVDE